jgi:hypothetical protein
VGRKGFRTGAQPAKRRAESTNLARLFLARWYWLDVRIFPSTEICGVNISSPIHYSIPCKVVNPTHPQSVDLVRLFLARSTDSIEQIPTEGFKEGVN